MSRSIEKDACKCDDDMISISIIPSDRCPLDFLYSRLVTEISSDIGEHPDTRENLVHYSYQHSDNTTSELEEINKFDQIYTPDSAIS